jgi:DNA-binding MarR family transcriptional regulator
MSQGPVEDRPGYLVKQVQLLLRGECDRRLRAEPAGVASMSQYAVLRALADHPQASSAELARLCFVTRQSLQDVLRGLRAAGFVTVGSATTGRARPVELTEAGRAALAVAHREVLDAEALMVAGLPEAEETTLVRLLKACARNLSR